MIISMQWYGGAQENIKYIKSYIKSIPLCNKKFKERRGSLAWENVIGVDTNRII